MLSADCYLGDTMKKLTSILIFVAASLFIAQGQAALPSAAQQAVNGIDAERIRATVKYISDDSFQGRGTGQKGGDMAADWLAEQFNKYGLQPAGDKGTV